jgi:hypothetical protein
MEQSFSPLAVEKIPGKHYISAPILPRERDFSLEQAQMCNLLIYEQSSGPLAIEMVPRKHCNYSTYLAK